MAKLLHLGRPALPRLDKVRRMAMAMRRQAPPMCKRRAQAKLRPLRAPPSVRDVRLPPGWAGVSFKALGFAGQERLLVTDVPKACFSSPAFGAAAAAQVGGVRVGDEIVAINGDAPERFAERVATVGDALNACSAARPPHLPGALDKYAAPPCTSCDLVRRRADMGLAAALQLWMRATKRDTPIVLGVRTPSSPLLALASPRATAASAVAAAAAAAAARPATTRKRPLPAGIDCTLGDMPRPAKGGTTPAAAAPAAAAPVAAAAPFDVAPPRAVYNPLRPAASAASTAPAALVAVAAPVDVAPPRAVYNPLRPAASASSAAPAAPAAKKAAGPPPAPKIVAGGFSCEEWAVGSGDKAATLGQSVTFKYDVLVVGKKSSVISAKKTGDKHKDDGGEIVERGEITCRLGEAEVVDGWMDGNLDIEEVLASWGHGVTGMRLGGKRRIRIPPKAGFCDSGGDVIPKGAEVLFDVTLKKLG